jgi:2-dehydro-3-deoxyphosphogluconate aldolase/(4S)-4-hydroxy-2-oxoglutarate aldolase
MILESLARQRVLPILRDTRTHVLVELGRALKAGGCQVLEITLMSQGAYEAIFSLQQEGLQLGAGTVLSREQAALAKQAGAQFLVSPGLCEELLNDPPLPYFPGVSTPSEVMRALASGQTNLKLFPAEPLGGTAMLSALRGPFPQVRWLPTGNIRLEQVGQYLQAGALAVGLGGQLFPKSEVESGEWEKISQRFRNL